MKYIAPAREIIKTMSEHSTRAKFDPRLAQQRHGCAENATVNNEKVHGISTGA
jgi:hypothetical protein